MRPSASAFRRLCRRSVTVAPAALVLSCTPASATAGGPQQRHAARDMRAAHSVLLLPADVRSWSAAASDRSEDPLTCSPRLTPRESDLTESGRAFGPLMTHGNKEALAQSVHVYATPRQAEAAWARQTLKKTVLCMQRRLEDTSTMMSWISAVQWRTLTLPHLVPRVAGYRVIGDAQAGRQKSRFYLDVILLGRDRASTMLVTTSYGKALPSPFEDRLVRITSTRLRGG